MQYRDLGRTGITVSPYCIAAMVFGAIGNPTTTTASGSSVRQWTLAVNLVGTADRYSDGEPEKIADRALEGRRDKVLVQSALSIDVFALAATFETRAYLRSSHRDRVAAVSGRRWRPGPADTRSLSHGREPSRDH